MDHLPDHPICAACTYPMAPPDRGRCPECGHYGRLDTRLRRLRRTRLMGLLLFITTLLLAVSLNALILHYTHPLIPGQPAAARWVPQGGTQGQIQPAPRTGPRTGPTPAALQQHGTTARVAYDARFVPTIIATVGTLAAAVISVFARPFARFHRRTRQLILVFCMTPYYAAAITLIALFLVQHASNTGP